MRSRLVVLGIMIASLLTVAGCEEVPSSGISANAQNFLRSEMAVPYSIKLLEVLSHDSLSATVLIRGDVKTADAEEPIPSESILWLENYGGEWRVNRHLPFRPLDRASSPARVSNLRLGEGASCDPRKDERGDITFDDAKDVYICFDFESAENDIIDFVFDPDETRLLFWKLQHDPTVGHPILIDGSGSMSKPLLDVKDNHNLAGWYTVIPKLNSVDIDNIRFRVEY